MTFIERNPATGRWIDPNRDPDTGQFVPGHMLGACRPAGVANKITRDIRNGIIDAAIAYGADGNGTNGLQGFFGFLLREDLRCFCTLLGRCLPVQLADANDNVLPGVNIIVSSVETGRFLVNGTWVTDEQARGMRERGEVTVPVIDAEDAA